jgi:hypothetical protein
LEIGRLVMSKMNGAGMLNGDHIVIGTSFWTLGTFDTAVTYSQEEQVWL